MVAKHATRVPHVPRRFAAKAAIGYRFPAYSTFAGVEIQVNAVNLTNERYIAALGSGQFFNEASSLNDTLQAGSPRLVFGTVRGRS